MKNPPRCAELKNNVGRVSWPMVVHVPKLSMPGM
jgi:hypothetical protein